MARTLSLLKKYYLFFYLAFILLLCSCSAGIKTTKNEKIKHNLEKVSNPIPQNIIDAEFSPVWKILLNEVKNYELASLNKWTGQIKTRWIDNSSDFRSDAHDGIDPVSARFYLLITAKELDRNSVTGNPQTLVAIFKKQQYLTSKETIEWLDYPTDKKIEESIFQSLKNSLQKSN